MPNTCAKNVYRVGTISGKITDLSTWQVVGLVVGVVNVRNFTHVTRATIHHIIHRTTRPSLPVIPQLIPTIHSTNNKQLQFIKGRN